jgi:hypothetical protein
LTFTYDDFGQHSGPVEKEFRTKSVDEMVEKINDINRSRNQGLSRMESRMVEDINTDVDISGFMDNESEAVTKRKNVKLLQSEIKKTTENVHKELDDLESMKQRLHDLEQE